MVAAIAVPPVLIVAGPAQAATTVALWHMEDPARLVDSSAAANHGTTTAIAGVPGAVGNGYRFNGRTSVASVPDRPSLDPGTATLRVTARVRFTVPPSPQVVDYDLVRVGHA